MTQRATSVLRLGRALSLVMALAMILGACSSGSDPSTTTTSPGVTTSNAIAGTTTTLDGATTTTSTGQLAIEILAPPALSTHLATVDLGGGALGAAVIFRAEVTGGTGGVVVVTWESDLDGQLGTGLVLNATLSNGGSDVVQHKVTVTASSPGSEIATATVDVVVKVPSN